MRRLKNFFYVVGRASRSLEVEKRGEKRGASNSRALDSFPRHRQIRAFPMLTSIIFPFGSKPSGYQ
jgi:hypothetical protein